MDARCRDARAPRRALSRATAARGARGGRARHAAAAMDISDGLVAGPFQALPHIAGIRRDRGRARPLSEAATRALSTDEGLIEPDPDRRRGLRDPVRGAARAGRGLARRSRGDRGCRSWISAGSWPAVLRHSSPGPTGVRWPSRGPVGATSSDFRDVSGGTHRWPAGPAVALSCCRARTPHLFSKNPTGGN